MADTTFSNGVVIQADWMNDVNDNIYGPTAPAGTLRAQLSSTDSASAGAGMVGFKQSGTGAVPRSVMDKMREVVSVKDFGAVGDGVTDDTAAIQDAENYCEISGQDICWPAGIYRCNSSITKKSVNWFGAGRNGQTTLKYYGNSVFINATGTNPSRLQGTIFDMKFDGTSAGTSAECITLGWNQRSTPLERVWITMFAKYGIHFNDQNWIVDLNDVFVDKCGASGANSCGIFKDASIDLSTWNGITFNNLTVEFCGNAGSTAGGVYLPTTTANRGVYFNNALIEDNLGTNEIQISNTLDVQFLNLYIERTNIVGQLHGVQLDNCTGGFRGGYITGAVGANLHGIKATSGSVITVDGVSTPGWATSGVGAFASTVYSGRNPDTTYYGDATAQWFGDYAPRVSAHKNATDQVGVPTATFTKVTFGTERYDLTNAYSGSTFTPQTVGTYRVSAQVTFTAAADQDLLICAVYLNGAAYRYGYNTASGVGANSVSISVDIDIANPSDTIEIYTRQTSGSNKDISGAVASTWFMASLIGRTS